MVTSDTDEDWEEMSSTSSDHEILPTESNTNDTNKTKSPQLKPWSKDDLDMPPCDSKPLVGSLIPSSFSFEKEESALTFLQEETISSQSDVTCERIFRMATFGYRQIGHDSNMPIVIEFDSLVLNIFDHALVDWTAGGQSLHITYILERFLAKLCSGNRSVEINAFRCMETLWAPSPAKRLIRNLLLANLRGQNGVSLKEFDDWLQENWKRNFEMINASFVLLSGCDESRSSACESSVCKRIIKFAMFLFATQIKCVRVEELFYYSNALFGFVFEVFPAVSRFIADKQVGLAPVNNELYAEGSPEDSVSAKEASSLKASGLLKIVREKVASRHVLAVYGCAKLLCSMIDVASPTSGSQVEINKEAAYRDSVFHVKIFLMSEVLKKQLPLRYRARRKNSLAARKDGGKRELFGLEEFVEKFCEELCVVFKEFSPDDLNSSCDLVDGRLLSYIEYLATKAHLEKRPFELPGTVKPHFEELWSQLISLPPLNWLSDAPLYPTGGLTVEAADGNFLSIEGSLPIEHRSPKTFPFYTLSGPVAKELSAEVDALLESKDLLYGKSSEDMSEFDDTEKVDSDLFICSRLEGEMKDSEQNKQKVKDLKTEKFENKNKARFYAFMKKYSETLSQPKIVLRDVIVEDVNDSSAAGSKNTVQAKSNQKSKGKKQKNNRKDEIRSKTASRQSQKAKDDIIIFIQQALKPLELEKKIEKLDDRLLPLKDPLIALPGQIQLLEWLKELYKKSNPEKNKYPATLLFRNIYDIYRRFKSSITLEQFNLLQSGLLMMGFFKENKKLVEDFNAFKKNAIAKTIDYANDIYCEPIGMSCVRFQLKYAGHFMVRSIKSREDPRVSGFFPDDWQRLFLDAVDKNESCLVVTPTSSGKTFISYYTMKKILNENRTTNRKSEKKFVVFVCPSKALVNQVSADIYERYGEIFGVDTLDYDRKVVECEVLVTIPESFEKILLSPPFENFVKRIKYVIMDEIHSIGDPTGGEIWERIILLIQCPFIALSATLGDPKKFHRWLTNVSNSCESQEGISVKPKVNLIEFYERWSDLEKFVYIPRRAVAPTMAINDFERETAGKDEYSPMVYINPFCAFKLNIFTNENFKMPELVLTSRDCLEIFDVMLKVAKELPEANKTDLLAKVKKLDPEKFFRSPCITKNEVTTYGKLLIAEISAWHGLGLWREISAVFDVLSRDLLSKIEAMESEKHPCMPNGLLGDAQTPSDLPEKDGADERKTELQPLPNTSSPKYDGPYSDDFLMRQLIPMLIELRNKADLPAIVFARSQNLCDKMALETLRFFETNEKFVLSRNDLREMRKNSKLQAKTVKAWKRERDRIDKRKEEEMLKEGTIPPVDIEEDDDVDSRFSFIPTGERLDEEDMKYWLVRTLKKNNWSKGHPFLRCINRGIAVHHNGMSKAYRTLVEVLFRERHIKVVLTVGTLALGVNMPCRTTVFAGDSSELTPLRYNQMMGRAGRRGYDNIGKVIFFGIPPAKISYLMTSSLLALHGNDTLTMTTFLRNVFCVAESNEKNFRLVSFKNLMKRTFGHESYSDDDERQFELQMKLFYRFCMEYLYQNELVNRKLVPVKLAGLVTLLYPTEPANFVFVILLQSGVFDKICGSIGPYSAIKELDKPKEQKQNEVFVCTSLLEVLAHIFYRVPLPRDYKKPSYFSSKVVLDPLLGSAKLVVDRFNATTVALYTQFYRLVQTFCAGGDKSSHEDGRCDIRNRAGNSEALPISKIRFGGEEMGCEENPGEDRPGLLAELEAACNKNKARSGFVGLAGHSDKFESGVELLDTARVHQIDLKKTDSVPVLELKDFAQHDLPLNSYALDFFKQGSLFQVMKENNLPELFVWSMLKNWSLTLKAISTGLQHVFDHPEQTPEAEKWSKTVYAFRNLSEMFDAHFNKIGEIVDYNDK